MKPDDSELERMSGQVPGTALLPLVNYPVIEARNRQIQVVLEDVASREIRLTFQPYQAMKLTGLDCFPAHERRRLAHDQITYQMESSWLAELKAAAREIDARADFMDRAVHFTIPSGDDVLEVVAWSVEVRTLTEVFVFPPGVELPPF